LNHKLLSIYLNDHYAGSMGGLELVRRSAGANEGTEFGPFLSKLAEEFAYDREALGDLMDKLDVSRDRVKVGVFWVAEKAGRLKLNGSLTGYSPLSRVVELEGLTIGIRGKLSMWEILEEVAIEDHRLADFDLKRFSERAEDQLAGLTPYRLRAGRLALADSSAQPPLS